MYKCDGCGKETETGFVTTYAGKQIYACGRQCQEKALAALPYNGKGLESYSRVTGYLQNVDGWNPGKRAELHDRFRDKNVAPAPVKAVAEVKA